jgi:hypothetical protein
MTTFLQSPNSSRPAYTFYNDERTPRNPMKHTANLSGATMLDLLSGPEGSIAAAYTSSHAHTNKNPSKSKRSSYASSTKSQLKQTNHTLLEMLRNVQIQLATQTGAMIDMQRRIAQLESASTKAGGAPRNNTKASCNKPLPQINNKEDLTRETKKWWEACQFYAKSADPPFNATEFFKSPVRFSGFNFDFDLLNTIPRSPITPTPAPLLFSPTPELDDVPSLSLTPTSDQQADVFTPGMRRIPPRLTRARTTGMYHDAVSDIREHIVEFDRVKVPMPPVLQTPPKSARSRLTALYTGSRDSGITALPQMPGPPQPLRDGESAPKGYKLEGIKRMLSLPYRASSIRRGKVVELDGAPAERCSGSLLRC